MSRRFVALGLPATLVRGLAARWEATGWDRTRLRATRPSGWHVTLAYLGDTAATILPSVVATLEDVLVSADPPPQLRLTAGGRLGRSVLAVEVQDRPAGALAVLGGRIQAGLAAAGHPVRHQAVRGHVTLARARRRDTVGAADVALVSDAVAGLDAGRCAWVPTTVGVWVALPGTGPARYEVEAVVPLGA